MSKININKDFFGKYIEAAFAGKSVNDELRDGGCAQIDSCFPVTFDFNGQKADLCNFKESVSEKTDSKGVRIITRRFIAEDGLVFEAAARIYDGAVDWTGYFENCSDKNSGVIENVDAVSLNITYGTGGRTDKLAHLSNPVYNMGDENFPVLSTIRGNKGCQYNNLNEFLPEQRPVRNGQKFNYSGVSCGGDYSPYFELTWPGGGVVFAIGWTGNWRASFENKDGILKAGGGMNGMKLYLKPGERIRTPRIMLVVRQGGIDDGYNTFRRAFIDHLTPRDLNGQVIYPPICTPCPDENSTNGEIELKWVGHDMDETDAEVYWHDAWWHKNGFPDGMGNYTFPIEKCVDPLRYPKGVKILGEKSHEKGYKFLLWFAPESYPEGSTMQKEHPEWLLTSGGNKGGTLNLANEEALEYITRYLDTCIKEYGIDIWRTDSGISFGDIRANEEPGRTGLLEIRCVEGLYCLWDQLILRNPGLIIDNCCGGGTRLDLELCSRSVSLWRSDTSVWLHGWGDMVRHPILNQCINSSFNRYIPYTTSATCNYDPYTVRSGFNGGTTLTMDLRKPDFDKAMLRTAFCEVRRLRKYTQGDFYRLIYGDSDPTVWCSYQYHLREPDSGCVFIFRRDASPYSAAKISLKGICGSNRYKVDYYYDYDKFKTVIMNGTELQALNVEIESAPGSLLLEYTAVKDFNYR